MRDELAGLSQSLVERATRDLPPRTATSGTDKIVPYQLVKR
jgi:hypothetical protein